MLIDVLLPNGKYVKLQFVKRGKTVYVRKAPYTIDNPTPAQKKVRTILTEASYKKFGSSREEVINNVKTAFSNYVRVPSQKLTLLNVLKRLYPADTKYMIEYLLLSEYL